MRSAKSLRSFLCFTAPSEGLVPRAAWSSRLASMVRAANASVLGCSFLLAGCGDPPPHSSGPARADVVLGTGTASPTTPPASASSTAPRKKRKLCANPAKAKGQAPADVSFFHVEADGETPLGESLGVAPGVVTWVNLWAGWCEPCKEEMPVLKSWESKFGGRLVVRFVSVDDDERLSKRFLNEQPKGGVRQSRWLKPGDDRKTWLESVGVSELGTLPVHLIFNKKGRLECVATGSIDPTDLDEVTKWVERPE